MISFWRNILITALVAVLLGSGISTALAGGHPHRGHHGYYSHSSFRLGLNWAYPSPYWRPFPPTYGYYPAYAPAWGPGVMSFGYSYGGYRSSYGLSFAIPLNLGPRYAPQSFPQPAPAAATADRKPVASCLQVREYQTEIVVGGKTVPAYGDACLQPDGSWQTISGPFAAQ
jgi:hypothetical protein